MKLAVIAMLRNEADIAPAFLAHLAALFDHAVLMDHGSSDTTPALLADACRRPGWRHWQIALAANHQQAVTNFALRTILADTDADFVIPLDADEFIDVPDRAALEDRLTTIDQPRMAGRFHWRNAVPKTLPTNPLRFDTELLIADTLSAFPKSVVPRTLAAALPGLALGKGAHVLHAADGAPIGYRDIGALLHLPIRSRPQFCRKILDGALGNLGRRDRLPGQSAHTFDLLEHLAHDTLDEVTLQRLALSYAEPSGQPPPASRSRLAVAHLPMSETEATDCDPLASIARTLMQWRVEALETDELELVGSTLRRKAGQGSALDRPRASVPAHDGA